MIDPGNSQEQKEVDEAVVAEQQESSEEPQQPALQQPDEETKQVAIEEVQEVTSDETPVQRGKKRVKKVPAGDGGGVDAASQSLASGALHIGSGCTRRLCVQSYYPGSRRNNGDCIRYWLEPGTSIISGVWMLLSIATVSITPVVIREFCYEHCSRRAGQNP